MPASTRPPRPPTPHWLSPLSPRRAAGFPLPASPPRAAASFRAGDDPLLTAGRAPLLTSMRPLSLKPSLKPSSMKTSLKTSTPWLTSVETRPFLPSRVDALPPVRLPLSRHVQKLKAQSRDFLEIARGLRPLKTTTKAVFSSSSSSLAAAAERAARFRQKRRMAAPGDYAMGPGMGTFPSSSTCTPRGASSTAPSPSSSGALPCDTSTAAGSPYSSSSSSSGRTSFPSTPPGSRAQHPRVKKAARAQPFERALLFQELGHGGGLDAASCSDVDMTQRDSLGGVGADEGGRPRSLSLCGKDVSAGPAEIGAAKEGHVISQLRILRAAAAKQQLRA